MLELGICNSCVLFNDIISCQMVYEFIMDTNSVITAIALLGLHIGDIQM